MVDLWGLSYSFVHFILYLTVFLYHIMQVGKSINLFHLAYACYRYCVVSSFLDSLNFTTFSKFICKP
jgi:hypothetical protein